MDDVRALLLATLRRTAPVRVRVYDAQDESYDVAVPTRRKRWSQVIETIEQRPWVRCALLDKAGGVLAHVANTEPAEPAGLEDISGGASAGAGGQALQTRMYLELMIKAQTTALTYRDKEHSALLQSMNACMQTVTAMALNLVEHTRQIAEIERSAVREHAQSQLDALMSSAQAQIAQASADRDISIDDVVELLRESPKLLQQLGPLIAGLGFLKPKPAAAAPAPAPAPSSPPPPAPAAPAKPGKRP